MIPGPLRIKGENMVYNWGKDFATLGTVGQIECPICGETRPEIAVVQYDYFGLMWLFNFAFNRKYLRVCDKCHQGKQVEPATLGPLAEKDNIPFLRKFGLFLLVGIIIVLGVLTSH
jgi:hypothetical protein